MPRLYHSASSIATISACMRRGAYRYIAGIREPSVEWADIASGKVRVLPRLQVPKNARECTPKQKSAALGVEMHRYGDAYWQGLPVPWESLPGQVLASGLHLLPAPADCAVIQTERAIGDKPSGESAERIAAGAIARAFAVHGMRLVGNRDLLLRVDALDVRVFGADVLRAIERAEGWLQADHKSTSSIESWAKRPADLLADVQCAIYTLEALEAIERDFGTRLDRLPSRWVYYETKDIRRAAPCDVVLSRDQALDVLAPCASIVREFDSYERVEDAPQNPKDCESYGSLCPHHRDAGGPCHVRRSVGACIQSHVKHTTGHLPIMNAPAMSMSEKFAAAKAAREAKLAAPDAAIEDAIEDATGDEVAAAVVAAPAKPVAPRKPRTPKAAPPPVEEIVDVVAEDEKADAELDELDGAPKSASDLLALAGEIAAIDDEIAVLQDRRTAALDALEAAVSAAR